jgi:type IV pilus assembly protein PilO
MEMPSISELDFNESGEWPVPIKVISILLICAAIWGAGYYFLLKDKKVELEALEQKEVELKKTFEVKQAKAVNLEAYKEQLAEMKVMFASMLEQLPKKSEVPELLVDVTRTGLINGLEFELFQPQGERPIDFYAELPIQMTVTGNYHQFGEFVSGLALLPRIVTVHDLTLGGLNASTGKMTMNLTAKTYRYFDDGDN